MALDTNREELEAHGAAPPAWQWSGWRPMKSNRTIGKRLPAIGLENSEEHRALIATLLEAPASRMDQWRESLRGTLFPARLAAKLSASGRLDPRLFFKQAGPESPAIKLDLGVEPAGGPAGESWCTGLRSAGAGRERLCRAAPLCQMAGVLRISADGCRRASACVEAWGLLAMPAPVRTRAWLPIVSRKDS